MVTYRLATLDSSGKWPDSEIDYATGCPARRANWPASVHWERIEIMSGAWHGGIPGAEQWVKSSTLRAAISKAMGYWIARDVTNLGCLDGGGTDKCPCEDPRNTLWNTNWYSNIILVPGLVGRACVLLMGSLSTDEAAACVRMTARSYAKFDVSPSPGYVSGANVLDIARIGVDSGILSGNITMISDAYRRMHQEQVIQTRVKADGIFSDGSFGQHAGVLYNGNYGKDYTTAVLDVEVIAAGTQFAANAAQRQVFDVLVDGHRWMIFYNTISQILHFDFSAIGRMITFPVIDGQASSGTQINRTRVLELGQMWSSPVLINYAQSLTGAFASANAGNLLGNRMFYANDYMAHRGKNYFTSLKMYSSRTLNTECVNTQNPLGFHLSDGTIYTYLVGNEYTDISAAWDWDLIPGTTTDYQNTPLNCAATTITGVETFVGGLSNGRAGTAAMRYTNPNTRAIQWQKTWFFLENDIQHVMINVISSTSSAPVYSVLDQKRKFGQTLADGREITASGAYPGVKQLWHANVGYALGNSTSSTTLNLRMGNRRGNWSAIGTSTQPPIEVDLWASWLQHTNKTRPVEYTAYPGSTYAEFQTKASQQRTRTLANNRTITALYDDTTNTAMMVFWSSGSSSLVISPSPAEATIRVTTTAGAVVMFSTRTGAVLVSDPSQTLTSVMLTFALGTGQKPPFWTGTQTTKSLTFQLPRGGIAGNSVSQVLT
ncbi:chondroitin AC lyase [Coprinopsis sp. MPI-PUGE-AT-0042]|nr:chondroitin AC lyase [Coprinopsis sp. MPI-PUGE-AT-0042]